MLQEDVDDQSQCPPSQRVRDLLMGVSAETVIPAEPNPVEYDPLDLPRNPGQDRVPKLPFSILTVTALKDWASRYGLMSAHIPTIKPQKTDLV